MNPLFLFKHLSSEQAKAGSSVPLNKLINGAFVWDRYRNEPCPKNSIRGFVLNLFQKGSESIPFERNLRKALAQALIHFSKNSHIPIDHAIPSSLALRFRAELNKEIAAESKHKTSLKPEVQALLEKQAAEKQRVKELDLKERREFRDPSLIHRPQDGETVNLETCKVFFGLKEGKVSDFLPLLDLYFEKNKDNIPAGWSLKRAQIVEGYEREQKLNEKLHTGARPLPPEDQKHLLRDAAKEIVAKLEAAQVGERVFVASSYGQRKMTFFAFCQMLQAQPLYIAQNFITEDSFKDVFDLFKDQPCENPENFARALYRLIVGRLQQISQASKEASLLFVDGNRKLPDWLADFLPEVFFQEFEEFLQNGVIGNLHPHLEPIGKIAGVAVSQERDAIAEHFEPIVVDWLTRHFLTLKATDQGLNAAEQLGEDLRTLIPPPFLELLGLDSLLAQGPILLELEKTQVGTYNLYLNSSGFALQSFLSDPQTGHKFRIKRFVDIPKEKLTIDYFCQLLSRHHEGLWDARRACRAEDFLEGLIGHLGGRSVHNEPDDPIERVSVRTLTQLTLEKLLQPTASLELRFKLFASLLRTQLNKDHQLEFNNNAIYAFAITAHRSLSKEMATYTDLPADKKKEYSATLREVEQALQEHENRQKNQSFQEELYREGFESKVHSGLIQAGFTREDLEGWRGSLRVVLGDEAGDLADYLAACCERLPLPTKDELKEKPAPFGWNLNTYSELYSTFARQLLELALAGIGFRFGGKYRLLSLPVAYRLASTLLSATTMEMVDLFLHFIGRSIAQLAVKTVRSQPAKHVASKTLEISRKLSAIYQRFFPPSPISQPEVVPTPPVKTTSFKVTYEEGREGITVNGQFFEQYRKANVQRLPVLEGHSGYLVLEKSEDKKILLERSRQIYGLAWRGIKYLGPLAETLLAKLPTLDDRFHSYDVTPTGELQASTAGGAAYLIVLELLKQEDSPALSSLWQNLLETTHLHKLNKTTSKAWEDTLSLGFAYNREMPYLNQKFRTENLALYRIRLFAHLQKHPEIFGKPNCEDLHLVLPSLIMVLIDLRRMTNNPDPRFIVTKEEEYHLYEFVLSTFKELLRNQLRSLAEPQVPLRQSTAPWGGILYSASPSLLPGPLPPPEEPSSQIKLLVAFGEKILEKGGSESFVEHFFLPPEMVKRLRKVRKECGHEPSRWDRAFRFVYEFMKASGELPSLSTIGSRVSTVPTFMETHGDFGRPFFEFFVAARRTLLQHLDVARLLQANPEFDAEAPFDPSNFSKGDLEKYFFTYYTIAKTLVRSSEEEKKNAQLGAILAYHRGGWDPHSQALMYLLQAVYNSPLICLTRDQLVDVLKDPNGLASLQLRMQTATLTQKLLLPITKYLSIYKTTEWALGRSIGRLGSSSNPVTKVAQEQALAAVLQGNETNSVIKQIGVYAGLALANKIPFDFIGSALSTAAVYTGMISPTTGVLASLISAAGLRFGLAQLLNQPFTLRQILPAPTYTVPLIKGSIKGVKALYNMQDCTLTDGEEVKRGSKIKRSGNFDSLKPLKTYWDEYFQGIKNQIYDEHCFYVKILLDVQQKQIELTLEKENFQRQLLQLFNPMPPNLITIEVLHQFVNKGEWGLIEKEPLHLTRDLLPQVEIALRRLDFYHERIKQCAEVIGSLERCIENRGPIALEKLEKAVSAPPRGNAEWLKLIDEVGKNMGSDRLILVQLARREDTIPFARAWKQTTRIAFELVFFDSSQTIQLGNTILALQNAKAEGLPVLMTVEDLTALQQIQWAEPQSLKATQAAQILKIIAQDAVLVKAPMVADVEQAISQIEEEGQ